MSLTRNSLVRKMASIKIVGYINNIHTVGHIYIKTIDFEKISTIRIPIKLALLKILSKVMGLECIMVHRRRWVACINETSLQCHPQECIFLFLFVNIICNK
jgi:hypothetical protein